MFGLGLFWRWIKGHRGVVEAVAVLVAYNAYEWLRAQCGQSMGPARQHGLQVVHIERALKIDWESALQRGALPHQTFVQFLDLYYDTVHFVVPALALVMLWRRNRVAYEKWRNRLVAMTLLALVLFWLWPVMPPRLLPPGLGFVDTDAMFGGLGVLSGGPGTDLNVNAAFPSLHVGWAIWSAAALASLVRTPQAKWALYLYPLFTLLTVTVTGNHYLLDAIGGVVVDLAGTYLGDAVTRFRARPSPSRVSLRSPEPSR